MSDSYDCTHEVVDALTGWVMPGEARHDGFPYEQEGDDL